MRTLAMLASSSLMLLLACGDKVVEDSGPGDSDTAGGSGSDGDGGTGGGSGGGASDGGGSGTPSSEQPPTMSNADAYCYQHQTGEEFWTWTVTGQADDPQGIDTLEAVVPDGVVVWVDGRNVPVYRSRAMPRAPARPVSERRRSALSARRRGGRPSNSRPSTRTAIVPSLPS